MKGVEIPGLHYIGTYTPTGGPFDGEALPLYEMVNNAVVKENHYGTNQDKSA